MRSKGKRYRIATSILMMVGAAFILTGCGKSFSSGDKVFVLLKDSTDHVNDGYAVGHVIQSKGKMVQVDVDSTKYTNETDSPLVKKLNRYGQGTMYVPIALVSQYKKGKKRYDTMQQAFAKANEAFDAMDSAKYGKAYTLAKQAKKKADSLSDDKEADTAAKILIQTDKVFKDHKKPIATYNALAELLPKFRHMLKSNKLYKKIDIENPSSNMNVAMATALSGNTVIQGDAYASHIPKQYLSADSKPQYDASLLKSQYHFKKAVFAFANDGTCGSVCQKQLAQYEKQLRQSMASGLIADAIEKTGLKKDTTLKAFDSDAKKIHQLVKPDEDALGKAAFDYSKITNMRKRLAKRVARAKARKARETKADNAEYKQLSKKTFKPYWGNAREKSLNRQISDLKRYLNDYPKGLHVKQAKARIAEIKHQEKVIKAKRREAAKRKFAKFEKTVRADLRHGTSCDNYATSASSCSVHATHISSDGHFEGYVRYNATNSNHGPFVENDIKGRITNDPKKKTVSVVFKETKLRKNYHIRNDDSIGWTWKLSGGDNQRANGYLPTLSGRVSWMRNGQKVGNNADISVK